MKFMLRMIAADARKILQREPADAIEPALEQQSGVHSNLHDSMIFPGSKLRAEKLREWS
jgi:hypothetical protein